MPSGPGAELPDRRMALATSLRRSSHRCDPGGGSAAVSSVSLVCGVSSGTWSWSQTVRAAVSIGAPAKILDQCAANAAAMAGGSVWMVPAASCTAAKVVDAPGHSLELRRQLLLAVGALGLLHAIRLGLELPEFVNQVGASQFQRMVPNCQQPWV